MTTGFQFHAGMPVSDGRQALQPGQWVGFQGRGGMQSFNAPSVAPFTQPAVVPGFAHLGFSPGGAPGGGSLATLPQPGFMARPPTKQRPESRPSAGFPKELRSSPQIEERPVGATRGSQTRSSGFSATFARFQQEFQSQAHEASMLDEKLPQHKPEPHVPHAPHAPLAYLERRLQWIQEDLQRQQSRLLEESVPKEDPMKHQERLSSAVEMLQKMQIERRAREALENKISGLESTLMKERAEHNLSLQQMRQKYEQVMGNIGTGLDMQLKSANDQLVRQSQHLEEMLKDVFRSVENRLANKSFSKGQWVPISLENRGESGSPPSWLDVGARIVQEQREANAPRHGAHGTPSMAAPQAYPSHPSSKQMSGSVLVQPNRAPPKGQGQVGGSMRVPKAGEGREGNISGKALGEMLQRLHQENQELQRVNQELSQQRLSRKGSKEASMTHSPILTPGGGKYAQWPLYRPAG